jgi:hypothetical protein
MSSASRRDELLLVLDARKRVPPSIPPRLEKLCLTILAGTFQTGAWDQRKYPIGYPRYQRIVVIPSLPKTARQR